MGIIIAVLLIIGGYLLFKPGLSECDILSEKFDSMVDNSQFTYSDEGSIVVGELSEIESLGVGRSMASDLEAYRLYFRGKDEIAPLYFMTTEGNNIPYLEDNFYSFDLKDIRVSGAHSGEFIDRDLNKLSYVQC